MKVVWGNTPRFTFETGLQPTRHLSKKNLGFQVLGAIL